MKKIFIDCGTHLFEGFEEFATMYSFDQSWECYCFEANPITFKKSQSKYKLLSKKFNINHENKAISDQYGKVKVNCVNALHCGELTTQDFSGQGSNILQSSKISYGNWEFKNKDEDIFVDSVDFSHFLQKIASKEDFVLVKMDIEGSEFAVIDQLIHDSSFKIINKFYCEFHPAFFDFSLRVIFVILFFVILNKIPFSLNSFLKASSSFTFNP